MRVRVAGSVTGAGRVRGAASAGCRGRPSPQATLHGRSTPVADMLHAMSVPVTSPQGPQLSGRIVVYVLVACGIVAGAAATAFRLSNHGRITQAQLKALPTLLAEVVPTCERPDGTSSPLRKGEGCGAGSALVLTPRSRGAGTEAVFYALLSEGGALVGPMPTATPERITLSRTSLGQQTLALVMAGGPLTQQALEQALAGAGGLAQRQAALDRLVADTIAAGRFQARSERRDFVVTP